MVSKSWFRVSQMLVLAGTAAACFGLGVLWSRSPARAGDGERKGDGSPSTEKPGPAKTDSAPPLIEAISIRAEFNPQSALLLGANELVRYQQSVFKDVVRALNKRIPIIGIVNNEDEIELGQALLDEAELPPTAVWFVKHPLDSMWLRDFGPLFSRWSDGRVEVIDTLYRNSDENGTRTQDDAFTAYIGRVLGMKVRKMPLVIEGGNLLSNGDGLMVTTTKVIDQPENRNLSLEQIGGMLKNNLGCRLWVYVRGLQGEPTGHIDFCMTFLRRNLAVVGQFDADYDPVNAAILDSMAETLRGQPTSMGPMKVERVYMPPRTAEGHWRSYCNVLMCNGALLVPSYADVDPAKEKEVHATFKRLVPGLEIAPIPCDSLVKKRGVLHCIGITIPGYVNVHPLLGESVQ